MNKSFKNANCLYCNEPRSQIVFHVCEKPCNVDGVYCPVCGGYLLDAHECGELFFIQVCHGSFRSSIGVFAENSIIALKKLIHTSAFDHYFGHVPTIHFLIRCSQNTDEISVSFNGKEKPSYSMISKSNTGHPYFEKMRIKIIDECVTKFATLAKQSGQTLSSEWRKYLITGEMP
ncbi:MAG: hypothetical protein HRU28_00160 [Rhizobiales bacterium]|nr:hypothetical protein [Hyphomicrobiales bacterium]